MVDKESREKIFPYLTVDVFDTLEHERLVQGLVKHKEKYAEFPTVGELRLSMKDQSTRDELQTIMGLEYDDVKTKKFVLDVVEDHLKKELLWNEFARSHEVFEQNKIIEEAPEIVDKLQDILAFSFDTEIGLDFKDSGERMFDALNSQDKVVSSGIKNIDNITKGGFHEKSLTLFMAETNMGKTLIKCGLAVNTLLQNKNVLYVTMEMSEDKISERILANLFDVELDNLALMTKDRFMKKFNSVKDKLATNLVIKEYPTKSVNTNRIRNLLKELEVKKKFIPDIIFIDYLGIMCTNRKSDVNSNTELKSISEELRGLAVEFALPIVSAVQTNRGGFGSAEIDLTDIADSIGTTATADIIIGVTQTPELRAANLYTFIILKNRYGLNKTKTSVGVDYPKMRVYDALDEFGNDIVEQQKTDIVDDAAVMLNHRKSKKRGKVEIT